LPLKNILSSFFILKYLHHHAYLAIASFFLIFPFNKGVKDRGAVRLLIVIDLLALREFREGFRRDLFNIGSVCEDKALRDP
jgi:hypothetical protein